MVDLTNPVSTTKVILQEMRYILMSIISHKVDWIKNISMSPPATDYESLLADRLLQKRRADDEIGSSSTVGGRYSVCCGTMKQS